MGRRLAAILAADMVGFSKAMSEDEAGTLARLKSHRAQVFDPAVAEHNGRTIKLMGDGAMVESLRRKASDNLSAYDCYLHGRWLYDRSAGQDPEALALFRKAVEIDPSSAQAHIYIALAHAYSVYNIDVLGENPAKTALTHARQALVEGEGDHVVHAAAGLAYIMCCEHELADTHSAEAVKLNPNAIYGLLVRGYVVSYLGDPEEGDRLLREALQHDPLAPDFYHELLAEVSYMCRDYENAINIYKRWKNPPAHMYLPLAICLAQHGRQDEADAAFECVTANSADGFDVMQFVRSHIAMCRRLEDAEHWLEGYRKIGLQV